MASSKLQNKKSPRIVLYLGAGASQFAGYHTFATFPELLFNYEVRQAEGMPPLGPNSERLLKAIKGSLERNNEPTTHDRFLWRLDGYTQLLTLNQNDDALQDFLRDNTKLYDLYLCTEEAINRMATTTVSHYSSNMVQRALDKKDNHNNVGDIYNRMKRVFLLYKHLAKLNGDNPLMPIFTTNYDMLIEDLCSEFEGERIRQETFVNGIPEHTSEGATWTNSLYKCQANNTLYKFHLCRLHGCVCWFYHSPGDANVYFHRWNAVQQPTRNLCAMYPGLEREKGAYPHGYGFRNFFRSLINCELAVFIGFSFRDDDVMHVLLKALADRGGSLKLLIVDALYNANDIIYSLENAARRSTFPFRVPLKNEISSLRMDFGVTKNFDSLIIDQCESLLD